MGVLCLGVHGTWKVGGADIRKGAAISGRKEPAWFLGRLKKKEVALLGRISGVWRQKAPHEESIGSFPGT